MALGYAAALRAELAERNRRYAAQHRWACCESRGGVTLFEPVAEPAAHGNFLAASYAAIQKDAEWRARFRKEHSHKRNLPQPQDGGVWRELDSCMSSDALLMNVFCHPQTLRDGRVGMMLGVSEDARPRFGVRARVPLASGLADRTEVDMRLGELLVEAKLTEGDFQQKAKEVVHRYRDFEVAFDRRALPQTKEKYLAYQLIRNVLAAQATGMAFCVLLDARRKDLVEDWHAVMRAVRPTELRTRCKTLTWQELATVLPSALQRFLAEKYGIGPAD